MELQMIRRWKGSTTQQILVKPIRHRNKRRQIKRIRVEEETTTATMTMEDPIPVHPNFSILCLKKSIEKVKYKTI
jgi:hypothetical protein